MGVIIYPCWGPGTLWHLKVIVTKQRWVRVLRSRTAINEMLCWLSAICRCFLQSCGHSALLASKGYTKYDGGIDSDVGNLMNVTRAIQGYFSSNFSFRLSAVHPTAGQCRFGILSHLTGHYPARDGLATQSTWCYVCKYVPVNFLKISTENVKCKLVKSPYLLSVSWTAVEMYTKKWWSISAAALTLEANRSHEQCFVASTCGTWEPGLM